MICSKLLDRNDQIRLRVTFPTAMHRTINFAKIFSMAVKLIVSALFENELNF